MTASALLLWGLTAVACVFALRAGRGVAVGGARFAGNQLRTIIPMLAFALPAAGFIAELMPDDLARLWLGPESGLTGIVIASFAGGLIPGGPFVSFPVVLVFVQSGAGVPQMVALTSGWAAFAFHRVLMWEVPVMGFRFAALRLLVSLALPTLSGLAAQWLLDAGLFRDVILP
jgi:uncharacterized membrane protein YraQ (UPF0718 family)